MLYCLYKNGKCYDANGFSSWHLILLKQHQIEQVIYFFGELIEFKYDNPSKLYIENKRGNFVEMKRNLK